MQIIIKLTTSCNFSCVYCSEGDQPRESLSPKVFHKLVDEIPELLEKHHSETVEFLWHGGEPLLYGKENLTDLMDYAKEQLSSYSLRFLMQTNGYLIDDEWIDIFRQYDISPGISLDGFPEMHDRNRQTQDGKPTADVVLRNLIRLRDAGVGIGTLMVVDTAEPIDGQRLFSFICKYSLHPKIHAVIPCGYAEARTDTGAVHQNYVKLLMDIYDLCIEDGTVSVEPLEEIMNAILKNVSIRECSFNGTCGKDFICLYPDGEVGFCGRDNSTRHFSYGNLKEYRLIELYESPNAEKIRARQEFLKTHECRNCPEWALCHGGCAFEAVNAYGKLEAKYPYCEERKRLLQYLRMTGLQHLKERLLRKKNAYRTALEERKRILKEVADIARE